MKLSYNIDAVSVGLFEPTTSQPSNTFLALLFFSYAVCCFSFLSFMVSNLTTYASPIKCCTTA